MRNLGLTSEEQVEARYIDQLKGVERKRAIQVWETKTGKEFPITVYGSTPIKENPLQAEEDDRNFREMFFPKFG